MKAWYLPDHCSNPSQSHPLPLLLLLIPRQLRWFSSWDPSSSGWFLPHWRLASQERWNFSSFSVFLYPPGLHPELGRKPRESGAKNSKIRGKYTSFPMDIPRNQIWRRVSAMGPGLKDSWSRSGEVPLEMNYKINSYRFLAPGIVRTLGNWQRGRVGGSPLFSDSEKKIKELN